MVGYHCYQYSINLFCRVLQGIVLGNATLTSTLHAIWVVSELYFLVERQSWFMFGQICLGIFAAALSWVLELSRLSEVKSTLEVEKTTKR